LWRRCSARVLAMAASFVLIHSPSVGPRTWQPVAHCLTELGREATVPSLLHLADDGPPFWPRVVDAVRAGMGTAEQGQGVVLVAHSNVGLFIRVITAALPGQVLGCVFVDAALPPAAGAAPVATPELLALLRDKAVGWAAAALDRLVGRGGGGAAVPGPADPPGSDRGAAEAAVVLLRGVGAGASRLGCTTVRLPAVWAAL